MNRKPLVLVLVGALGIVSLVVIVVLFRRNGNKEEDSSIDKAAKNLEGTASERGMGQLPEVVLVSSSASSSSALPASPPTVSTNTPVLSSVASAVPVEPASTLVPLKPPAPQSKPATNTSGSSLPSSGLSGTLNSPTAFTEPKTSINLPVSSSSPTGQPLVPPPTNPSTSTTNLTTSPPNTSTLPNNSSTSSISYAPLPKVTTPTKLTIVEDYFSGLPDRKLAGQLESLFKKESTAEDFRKLREGEAVDNCTSINNFTKTVRNQFYDFINKGRTSKDVNVLKVADAHFPKILRVEEINTEQFYSSLPKNLAEFIQNRFSDHLMYDVLNPVKEEPFSEKVIRDCLELLKDLKRYFQDAATTGLVLPDPNKLEEAFRNAAAEYIKIKSKPIMFKLLGSKDRAGYEKMLKDTKALITELSLGSDLPADFFNDIEAIVQEASKSFEGMVVLASVAPRPVINSPGNFCFAIATLQALATFFPTFQPSPKMDVSANDTPAIFVKIMRELLSGKTTPFDIWSTAKLPTITDSIGVDGGRPVVFFDNLQGALRQESVKGRGLELELILRVVSLNLLTQSYEYFGNLSDLALDANSFCDSAILSNAGALLVFTFKNADGKLRDDLKDIPLQMEAPKPFSQTKRKYLLGALVGNVSGHSIALVKRQSGQWYLADDASIFPIREDQLPLKVASQQKPITLGLPRNYGAIFPCVAFYYLTK